MCKLIKTNCVFFFISELPPCFSARNIIKVGSIPSCREDGTYEPVQCHSETRFCWCVTPQGRPLPDTSVRDNKPNCDEIDVSSSTLLSPSELNSYKMNIIINNNNKNDDKYGPARRSPKRIPKNNTSRHSTKDCSRQEKSDFNKNLIDLFKIEYRRINSSDGNYKLFTLFFINNNNNTLNLSLRQDCVIYL